MNAEAMQWLAYAEENLEFADLETCQRCLLIAERVIRFSRNQLTKVR